MPNSNKKGAKNERMTAKAFTDWTGTEFVRVPRSGGLQWKNNLMVTGDIIASDPAKLVKFPFSIECKFYVDVKFQDLILDNNSKIIKWWEQSRDDAKTVKKSPLVLFRYNGMTKGLWFVVMEYNGFRRVMDTMKLADGDFLNFSDKFVIFTSNYLFNTDYKTFRKYVILCRPRINSIIIERYYRSNNN